MHMETLTIMSICRNHILLTRYQQVYRLNTITFHSHLVEAGLYIAAIKTAVLLYPR